MPATSRQPNRRPTNMDNIRRDMAKMIADELERKQMTQTEAAYVMRDAPSQISLVVTGKLRGFSTDRLVRMLNGLGRNVDIVVRNSNSKRGKTQLVAGRNRS